MLAIRSPRADGRCTAVTSRSSKRSPNRPRPRSAITSTVALLRDARRGSRVGCEWCRRARPSCTARGRCRVDADGRRGRTAGSTATGRGAVSDRRGPHAELRRFLELFVPPFRERTAQEWFERAEALHMTFALVQSVDDLFACPQLDARHLLRSEPLPGGGDIKFPGRPYQVEPTPMRPRVRFLQHRAPIPLK